MTKTYRFIILWLLCLNITLVVANNQDTPDWWIHRTGNFTFTVSSDFVEKELASQRLENAKDAFGNIDSPPPTVAYLNIKNAENHFELMYNTGPTGNDYGDNESFDKNTIEMQLTTLDDMLRGGEFELMKIGDINIIKYSNTNDGLYAAYYYLLDKTKVSFFVVIYPASDPEWEEVENSIFASLQRANTDREYYAMSIKDMETIESIMVYSLIADNALTMDMHTQFWEIIDRYGGVIANIEGMDVEVNVDETLAELGFSYLQAYYEDALIAYRTGEFVESENRKALSAHISKEAIEYRNDLILIIANREPLSYDGEKTVMDEELLTQLKNEAEDRCNTMRYNIETLYDRVAFEK